MSTGRHRFVSTDRRVREDRRFVAGKGRFVADIDLPNAKHVALVTCPHAAAHIKNVDKRAALAMPGVHYVLEGAELAAATLPLMTGLDTPNVPRRPLAFEVARYSGEWVAAVVADTRAQAEDAAEEIIVDYEPLPFVLDAEQALEKNSPLVHQAHERGPGRRSPRADRSGLSGRHRRRVLQVDAVGWHRLCETDEMTKSRITRVLQATAGIGVLAVGWQILSMAKPMDRNACLMSRSPSTTAASCAR